MRLLFRGLGVDIICLRILLGFLSISVAGGDMTGACPDGAFISFNSKCVASGT
jgi:hypothetical protein